MILNFKVFIVLLLSFHDSTAEELIKNQETSQCNDREGGNNSSCTSPNDVPKTRDYNPKCQYYMAQSSIPHAGFGIFTVKDIPAKTPLTPMPDGPSIVATDVTSHYGHQRNWNHPDYIWTAEGEAGNEAKEMEENVPNFGALSNFHPYFANIKPSSGEYDDTITPRGKSVGAGAYSYHPGYLFYASRDINAGEEIFAHYGDEWLDGRDWGRSVPQEEQYDKASEVIRKGFKKLGHDIEDLEAISKLIKETTSHFDKRSAALLPTSLEQIKQIQEVLNEPIPDDGEALDPVSKVLAESTITKRSVESIESEGICLDNLVPEISTIPDAGRGGFAQRAIQEGEIVVPVPLIQAMDFESMFMYEKKKKTKKRKYEEPDALQMLTNYCFSHDLTSMLLCPLTTVVLINHCSTRKSYGGDCQRYNDNEDPNKRGPNAKIQWGTQWDPNTPEWLEKSIEELDEATAERTRGISIEIVATRDILPGDEVFIDYGEGWENDWDEYVSSWVPPDTTNYVPLKEVRNSMSPYRTVDELKSNPYPDNVIQSCFYWVEEGEYAREKQDLYDEEAWKSDGSAYVFDDDPLQSYGNYWPCSLLERVQNDNSTVYTVEIFSPLEDPTIWAKNKYKRILTDYPEGSISFVMRPYTSDQHLPGAFRSYIRIPDDIIPEIWIDLIPQEGEDLENPYEEEDTEEELEEDFEDDVEEDEDYYYYEYDEHDEF